MRHKNKTKYLGRTASHRSAMLSNMASSLIINKRIFTTVPKAKALRRYVEPIITKSKDDTTNSRRIVFSMLHNKQAVSELFQTVSPKVSERPGGYTRILKTGYRLGDNAAMCFIELVDFNENMLSEGKTKKTRTRRSRRKSGGATEVAATVASPAKEVEQDKSDESKKSEKATAKEVVAKSDITLTDEAVSAADEAVEDMSKEKEEEQPDKES